MGSLVNRGGEGRGVFVTGFRRAKWVLAPPGELQGVLKNWHASRALKLVPPLWVALYLHLTHRNYETDCIYLQNVILFVLD